MFKNINRVPYSGMNILHLALKKKKGGSLAFGVAVKP